MYKFISKKLVFAYDNNQLLTLNSCNILIPEFKDLSIKYVLAILNSSVAQFYFSKIFNSNKVLRSHLESIPIPLADGTLQKNIIEMVENLLISPLPEQTPTYKKLDKEIAKLYNLTPKEYMVVCATT